MVVFMIVGKADPLYEMEIAPQISNSSTEEAAYLNQFILYSSLDMVYSSMWTNQNMYLKVVDKFNFQLVSAYVTQGGKTFLLLHNGKSEDAVRAFFTEVHELYVKFLMNPFYNYDAVNEVVDAPIISPYFDSQVRAFAKRLLM
eukprot:gene25760-34341_t